MSPVLQLSSEFGYHYINFEGTPEPPWFDVEKLQLVRKSFLLQSSDIVIATYPKCGTTWMQQIVLLLLNNGDIKKCPDPIKMAPWIESTVSLSECDAATWVTENSCPEEDNRRRVWKTHASSHLLPWKCSEVPLEKGKVIVVARNANDTAVSMMHHARDVPTFAYTGNWGHFQKIFCDGLVESGSFWEWYAGWYNLMKKYPNSILWVTYEDLKVNASAEVKRIADFLDIPCDKNLADSVVKWSNFDAMKSNFEKMDAEKTKLGEKVKKNHIRVGKVGGWRELFTAEDAETFEKKYQILCSSCPGIEEFVKRP